MPELKKARVREARPRDVGLFKKLWKAYLEEQAKLGGLIIPSEENVESFADIFRMYVDPDLPEDVKFEGTVLFIGEVAVLMWGDSGDNIKTERGNTAYAWGVYVTPDQRGKGLSDKLHSEARQQLKQMGFNSLYASVLEQNEYGLKALERGMEQELKPLQERSYIVDI